MTQMTRPDPYFHRDPYLEFVASEGIPLVEAFSVDCLSLELEPWARLGGRGAYVHLAGRGDFVSTYVVEIPAGGHLEPERHMHDEYVLVLSGRGSTTVELPGGRRHSFEWGPRSLFGIPLNAPHRHYNGSGSEPVRFAAATNLPIVLNVFHSTKFVYGDPFWFDDRFAEDRYFRGEGELRIVGPGRHQWETNLVADVGSFGLQEWKERGGGGSSVRFVLADATMAAHASEFPAGTYKKAHRHSAGAHIFPMTGPGYTLLWREGEDPTASIRIDWKLGTLFAPPDELFHQHFNAAAHPTRYCVLGFTGVRYPVLSSVKRAHAGMDRSTEEGGEQIEYGNEDPRILGLFERELAQRGVTSRMRELMPAR